MNANTVRRRFSGELAFDQQAFELAAVFLIVNVASVFLALSALNAGSDISTSVASGNDVTTGAGWAILEILFASALLGALLLYNRLPDLAQYLIKWNLIIGALLYLGASAGEYLVPAVLFYGGLFSLIVTLDHFGVWWILNNVFALALAAFIALVIGLWLSPLVIFVFLLAMVVYDHVFANKREWMFEIGRFALSLRLPVIFIRPTSLRCDFDDIMNLEEDNEKKAWGIGTADMAFPAAFLVALLEAHGLGLMSVVYVSIVASLIIATAFYLRGMMLSKGSGAGLPPLAGCISLAYVPVLLGGVIV